VIAELMELSLDLGSKLLYKDELDVFTGSRLVVLHNKEIRWMQFSANI